MKMICKIARTELRNLFYSPVAWFLTVVFLVQCGMYYSQKVHKMVKWQDFALENTPDFKEFSTSLTAYVFAGPAGFFASVLNNLFLFIPLLTMGMISKETNSGTVKLLYSSPVTVRQIVLGKYLSILLYNCLLLLIMGVFMLNGFQSIRSPDYGVVLAAAFAFLLLVSAYTAIGMFMSSLTSYQIVSALATFLLFYVLSMVGGLWQQYDFVRDLTYFLSINGRTVRMLRGLIATHDVVYFVLIIYMFIAFTLFRLKGTRESKPWYVKASRYLTVFVVVLIIGYATSRPGFIGYCDTTALQTNTIHEKTQKIIEQLGDDPLEITLYSNLLGDGIHSGIPQTRNRYVWDLWEKYIRFKPNIALKYVEYYDYADGDSSLYERFPRKNMQQIAEVTADMYGVSFSRYKEPAEIRKIIDLKPESYRLVMQLKYKGRTAFLRTYNDSKFWPDEMNIAAVLKRLAEGTGPTVGYVTGNLERSINKTGEREYALYTSNKGLRTALVNQGIDCETVSLNAGEVPAGIEVLVLADPKVELSDIARARIKQYVNKGGNLLVVGEPGKQQVVNPVLQPLGVQLLNGTLIEITGNEMPHMVTPYMTMAASELAIEDGMLNQSNTFLKEGIDTARVLNQGVAGIATADSGFAVKHLLVTYNKNTWAKVGKLVTDSADPVFMKEEGDYKLDSFTTAVSLSRQVGKKEQRIIVGGDADFLSNFRGGGSNLGMAWYSWLVDNRYPVYMPDKKPLDVLYTIHEPRTRVEYLLFVWIIPGLVLLFGTILLIRRKRQ